MRELVNAAAVCCRKGSCQNERQTLRGKAMVVYPCNNRLTPAPVRCPNNCVRSSGNFAGSMAASACRAAANWLTGTLSESTPSAASAAPPAGRPPSRRTPTPAGSPHAHRSPRRRSAATDPDAAQSAWLAATGSSRSRPSADAVRSLVPRAKKADLVRPLAHHRRRRRRLDHHAQRHVRRELQSLVRHDSSRPSPAFPPRNPAVRCASPAARGCGPAPAWRPAGWPAPGPETVAATAATPAPAASRTAWPPPRPGANTTPACPAAGRRCGW